LFSRNTWRETADTPTPPGAPRWTLAPQATGASRGRPGILGPYGLVRDHEKGPSPAQAPYQRKPSPGTTRSGSPHPSSAAPAQPAAYALVTTPPDTVGFQTKSRRKAYRNLTSCSPSAGEDDACSKRSHARKAYRNGIEVAEVDHDRCVVPKRSHAARRIETSIQSVLAREGRRTGRSQRRPRPSRTTRPGNLR
jgi:hypothetical protein